MQARNRRSKWNRGGGGAEVAIIRTGPLGTTFLFQWCHGRKFRGTMAEVALAREPSKGLH